MSGTAFEPAASFAGKYLITDATDPAGSHYTGEMTMEPHGLFGHVSARLSGAGDRFGLAVLFDNRLLIAWGPKDKVEIGAYRISGEKMTGIWVPPGAKGDDLSACGQEVSRRTDTGEWEIEKAYAIDQQPYTGRVIVTESGPSTSQQYQIVQVGWNLHDGIYHSFGLKLGDFMVTTFSFEPEQPYGISAYSVTPAGWEGAQVWKDSIVLAREQLKRA